MTSLTVLVPVFDEQYLVTASLERLRVLEQSPLLDRLQVIVLDDASRDRTAEVLAAYAAGLGITLAPAPPHAPRAPGPIPVVERGAGRAGKIDWLFLRHLRNGGKGAAIRTALARADGEITVIHDADLEYHPRDLLRFLPVFVEEQADAVFGSRFAGGQARRALLFRHELGNRLLTFLTNLVTNVNLTDMETCYKAVRTELLRSIPLVSDDFRLEPELTIKLAKREARIFEVPISYSGRTYQEGKKIGWRDGFQALLAILRFWWSDHVYQEDAWGSQILGRMARAPRFNAWMADTIRPFCGQRILEIGSGTGNLTRRLIPRDQYVASDINPLYLHSLRGLTADRPYLDVTLTDVSRGETFPRPEGGFDTVVCLNVVEHVDDDVGALRNIRDVLAPGRAGPSCWCRRGPRSSARSTRCWATAAATPRPRSATWPTEAGFTVRHMLHFNRVGRPAWWLNGKLLKRRSFGLFQIMMLNLLTPVFRLVDRALPFDALSLIAVLEPVTAPQLQVRLRELQRARTPGRGAAVSPLLPALRALTSFSPVSELPACDLDALAPVLVAHGLAPLASWHCEQTRLGAGLPDRFRETLLGHYSGTVNDNVMRLVTLRNAAQGRGRRAGGAARRRRLGGLALPAHGLAAGLRPAPRGARRRRAALRRRRAARRHEAGAHRRRGTHRRLLRRDHRAGAAGGALARGRRGRRAPRPRRAGAGLRTARRPPRPRGGAALRRRRPGPGRALGAAHPLPRPARAAAAAARRRGGEGAGRAGGAGAGPLRRRAADRLVLPRGGGGRRGGQPAARGGGAGGGGAGGRRRPRPGHAAPPARGGGGGPAGGRAGLTERAAARGRRGNLPAANPGGSPPA